MVKNSAKPFVHRVVRKGRTYYYFRRGGKYIRLPDDPDSREFDRAYWEIRSGKAKVAKTNFDALIVSYYQSPKFRKLKRSTQTEYRRTLEIIREKNAKRDFTKLKRKDVIAARDAYAETWRKANAMVEMLSILAKHAIDLEWIIANPASDVTKLTGGGYEAWPADKLRAFETYCAKHNLATELLAFHLCIGTGQRIGDVIKMEWDHFDGEYMEVVQDKTGSRIWIYCPAKLREHLAKTPKRGRFILAKNLTTAISKRRVQHLIKLVREKIDAEKFVVHGWRYNAALELAEAGCSDTEIQSVTGHKTLAMVQKYRSQANQKKLSRSAQRKRGQ